jgi:hypothetical protein
MRQNSDPLQNVARKGLCIGAFVGLIFGLLISGPHFHSWPAGNTLKVIFGCVALAAFAGYFVIPLLIGSLAKGGSGTSIGSGASNGESHGANLSHQLHSVSHDHTGHDHSSHTDSDGAF